MNETSKQIKSEDIFLDLLNEAYSESQKGNSGGGIQRFLKLFTVLFEESYSTETQTKAILMMGQKISECIDNNNCEEVGCLYGVVSEEAKQLLAQDEGLQMSFALSCEYGNTDMAQTIHKHHPKLILDRAQNIRKRLPSILNETKTLHEIFKENPNFNKPSIANLLLDIQMKVLRTIQNYVPAKECHRLVEAGGEANFPDAIKAKASAFAMRQQLKIKKRTKTSNRLI